MRRQEQRLQVWIASEVLLGYGDGVQTLGRRLSSGAGRDIAQMSLTGRPIGCRLRYVLRIHQELAIRDHCAYIRHLANKRFAQINSNGSRASTRRQTSSSRYDLMGIRNVRRPYQEPSMPKMRSDYVLADHR